MDSSNGGQINKRRIMWYLGALVFAAMAVLLVVVFVRKFRQSND